MKERKNTIRIHKEKHGDNRRIRIQGMGFSGLFAFFFTCAWWAALSSVFPVSLSAVRMTAGIAAASLLIVFCVHRIGKWVLFLLLAVPFLAAAWAGYFPSAKSSWALLLAGAVYYAYLSVGSISRKSILPFVMTAGLLLLMTGIAIPAGRLLDAGRGVDGSFYERTRARIHADVIDGVERFADSLTGTEDGRSVDVLGVAVTDGNPDVDPEMRDPLTDETQEQTEEQRRFEDLSGQQENLFVGDASGTGSAMGDLKSIRAFVPKDDPLQSQGMILPEKPTETVYLLMRQGDEYTGDSWTEMLPFLLESTPSQPSEYLSWPSGLDRLEALCEDWDKSSLEAVAKQIDRTLSSMAVYDTQPGATPEDQDFAEYFLFENQRGFCVHFATAAALLYRMCGYPAVYAEGYAIPPSAFRRTETGDGEGTVQYTAKATGDMGHAWCRVYDEENREWLDMEHTPPSSGVVPKENEKVLGSSYRWERQARSFVQRAGKILIPTGICLAVLAGAGGLYIMIRRERLRRRLRPYKNGSGYIALYGEILRMSHLAGNADQEQLERLKSGYPQIDPTEWDFLFEQVMRAMFYRADTAPEVWGRAYGIYESVKELTEKKKARKRRTET